MPFHLIFNNREVQAFVIIMYRAFGVTHYQSF